MLAIVDPKIQWVSDEKTALFAVILIAAWQTMGFNTVLFLAGLQNIPGELYEAATVDGAGAWDKFWGITLPLLAPTTFYVVSTTTIQAMQVFEQVFILMNPAEGPNNSTITLVLYLYRSGFQNFKQGYASAIAWVLFIVIFGLTLIPVPTPAQIEHLRKLKETDMKIQSYRLLRFISNFFLCISCLTFFALVMIFPFLYMLATSFKTPADTFRYPPRMLPQNAVTLAVDGYDEPLPLYYVDVDGEQREFALAKSNIKVGTYAPAENLPPPSNAA